MYLEKKKRNKKFRKGEGKSDCIVCNTECSTALTSLYILYFYLSISHVGVGGRKNVLTTTFFYLFVYFMHELLLGHGTYD